MKFTLLAGSDELYKGIRKSEIINDFLISIGDEIETEDELVEKRFLIERVIDRLVNHVSMIYNFCFQLCYFGCSCNDLFFRIKF